MTHAERLNHGTGATAHRRIIAAVVLYAAGLGLATVLNPKPLPRPATDTPSVVAYVLLTVGFQLLAIYAALADVPLRTRLLVCLGFSLFGLALLGSSIGRSPMQPSVAFSSQTGRLASLLIFMVGLLLPFRLYLGTIGGPGRPQPPKAPSLRSLFELTTYGACMALALSLGDRRMQASLLVWAAVLDFASFSPAVAVLSESARLRKLGFLCVVLLALAVLATGISQPVAAIVFGSLLVLPLAAAVLLRMNGYRRRR